MKRGQVFVRAQDETGRFGSADVLDLDGESFRAFVLGVLFRAQIVTGLRDEAVEGDHIRLTVRPGVRLGEGEE